MVKQVFMIMPFSNKIAENAYNYCIKKVCEEFDLLIRRADEIFTTNPIYDDIVKEINDASLVIVDASDSNPNVFYELGMAHTLKQKQTIIITQNDFNKTPFDISHFRIIKYENSIEGTKNLENQIRRTFENLLKDYKSLEKERLEFLIDFMVASDREADLAILAGIKKYKGLIRYEDTVIVDFHTSPDLIRYQASILKNSIKPFVTFDFINIEHDLVVLSEKGKAFAELIEDKGIVCDSFNEQIYTKNYIPFLEKLKKKKSGN
jgi:hypothetical protein